MTNVEPDGIFRRECSKLRQFRCPWDYNSEGVSQRSPGSRPTGAHPGLKSSTRCEPQRGSPGGGKAGNRRAIWRTSSRFTEPLHAVTQGALALLATLGFVGELLRSSKPRNKFGTKCDLQKHV